MQISDNKVGTSKTSSSSTIRLSYNISGDHSAIRNLQMNNQVTSSANKNDTLEHIKRTKKKATRDRQPANENKPATADMSDLTYSLIDDDHIDDQETINVGNLIIDLESSLEKEKIENEQANNNNSLENKSARNSTHPRSPASLSTESDASASSLTYRQRAARRRAQQRSPTSMSPCSSSPINSTPSSPSSLNKPNHLLGSNNNNNNDIKLMNDCPGPRSSIKSNAKSANKLAKDSTKAATAPTAAATNNGHTTRTVFKSSSDERGELKMKITREKKVSKNEHKLVASPNYKSPPGSSNMNNFEPKFERLGDREDSTKSSISSTKECGTSTSIATITEPECLGPCEPGTSVTLEGIVWQETDGGILVVNVTWRGKTYVGALLDCTRHDWAPPRLCESPSSDIDLKTNKGVRTKRIVTRSNGIGLDEKNLLQTTGKLRNGKGRRIVPANESGSCNKKQRESGEKVSSDNQHTQNEISAIQGSSSVTANKEADSIFMEVEQSAVSHETDANSETTEKAAPTSPTLIGCNEPNCSKKYRNLNGLQYHQSHAHNAESSQSNNHNDCSSAEDQNINDRTLDSRSPDAAKSHEIASEEPSKDELLVQQGKKRERTPSPDLASKHDRTLNPMQSNRADYALQHSPRAQHIKGSDYKQHIDSSSELARPSDSARLSPSLHRKDQSYESPQGQKSSAVTGVPQRSSPSLSTLPGSKSSAHSSKQSTQQQPPLPATTEEGMKPSGTSTGPPPAPHQANCYFNPAFLANTFNPYNMPPYFPRHLYEQMTPPTIPTSNAAFLTRFMNNMRAPPPPDSPSRLLSPSMPKNVPYPPFKLDPGMPQLPNSIPSMPPMNNTSLLSAPLPPMPPLSLAGGPNLRMPSQGDPLLPPSQNPFSHPPNSINPALGLPGLGNPLGPMGGPPMTNPAEDPLSKQFPRRFN